MAFSPPSYRFYLHDVVRATVDGELTCVGKTRGQANVNKGEAEHDVINARHVQRTARRPVLLGIETKVVVVDKALRDVGVSLPRLDRAEVKRAAGSNAVMAVELQRHGVNRINERDDGSRGVLMVEIATELNTVVEVAEAFFDGALRVLLVDPVQLEHGVVEVNLNLLRRGASGD